MKKTLLLTLLLSACTQTGPKFINCSDEKGADIALNIALESMENIAEVVYRTDFICKEEQPMRNVECYVARTGDKDFGNRGMIVARDQYVGECIIHELYHVELGVKYGDSCSSHDISCEWDNKWLEPLLDEYKEEKSNG